MNIQHLPLSIFRFWPFGFSCFVKRHLLEWKLTTDESIEHRVLIPALQLKKHQLARGDPTLHIFLEFRTHYTDDVHAHYEKGPEIWQDWGSVLPQ